MKETIKISLISFIVSLNVCIWRDAIGEVFDSAVFVILSLSLGLLLHDLIFNRK